MKKIFVASVLSCFSLSVFAQSDPVIMRINGKDVKRSEFEYSYNKNNDDNVVDKKSLNEYVDLFVNYKLKVEAALDARLDTCKSFWKEYTSYRNLQTKSMLTNQEYIDSVALDVYNRTKANTKGKDLLHIAHIFLALPQRASVDEQARLKVKIDSIYSAILSGAEFGDMAKQFSDDRHSATSGGMLPWISPNQTLKEFEDVAYSLKAGEMSKPFLSTAGYHIIKMYERKQLEPYEEKRDEILKFLESRGIQERAVYQKLSKMIGSRDDAKSLADVMNIVSDSIAKENSDYRNLIREYYDGLLLFEISNKEVWKRAAEDDVALEQYFNKHKSDYKWKKPHFKGIVYAVKEKSDLKKVEALLKSESEETKWASLIDSELNKDGSKNVKVQQGLFSADDNGFAPDYLFRSTNNDEKFKYAGSFGKMLKKGPKVMGDVRTAVVADYQNVLERGWIEVLRQKYKVEIFQEILKSVNNHPNN